jgi:hypothetical protein
MGMKHIYERSAKYTRGSAFIGVILYVIILQFTETNLKEDLGDYILAAFLFLMALGVSFFFQKAANKLPADDIDRTLYTTEFPIHELNYQRDISVIPTSYLVSNTGERLYKIAPSVDAPIARLFTIFELFRKGLFFPVTYCVHTMDEKLVSYFTIKNKWKFIQIKVFNAEKEHLSTAVLPLFSVKNRVIVYDSHNNKMFQAEAKSVYGDIDIDDLEGKRLATYRFGIFPYATHPAFEAQAMNIHVSLSKDLLMNEKLTFNALFFYWTSNSQ